MKIESAFNVKVETKIKTRIVNAKTGRIVKERPWEKNLIYDVGLNGMAIDNSTAQSCNPASAGAFCMIGSGTNPVKISSGAITFTQAATTLTASGGFFTAAMVGGLFKWGTGSGGVEVYITAFTSSTVVTVQTSATVAVPAVGVVWQVQGTGLQTHLFTSNSYQTNSGDCQTTYSATGVTYQRTYVFGVQASPYTVNEIGWNPVSSTTKTMGRLVLSSSDSVATTNFYVVVIAMTLTYSPNVPTAVADVGVNINTAGTAMVECLSTAWVQTTGATVTSSVGTLDNTEQSVLVFATATYTQQATIPGRVPVLTWPTRIAISATTWLKVAATRGTMRCTHTGSITTSGQTAYGVGLSRNSSQGDVAFDIKFTTPQVLPTGTFSPTFIFQIVYDRALVN